MGHPIVFFRSLQKKIRAWNRGWPSFESLAFSQDDFDRAAQYAPHILLPFEAELSKVLRHLPETEPFDLKPYEPLDDARRIHWKISARGDLYVRRDRRVPSSALWFWVDLSSSMYFGTVGQLKATAALESVAAFLFALALRAPRLSVGIVFGRDPPVLLRPAPVRAQLAKAAQHFADRLVDRGAVHEGVQKTLSFLSEQLQPSDVLICLSDAVNLDLHQLVALGGHARVRMILVSDPMERALPESGQWFFCDASNPSVEQIWDAENAGVREAYETYWATRCHQLQSLGLWAGMLDTAQGIRTWLRDRS